VAAGSGVINQYAGGGPISRASSGRERGRALMKARPRSDQIGTAGTLPLHELTASMVVGEALSRSGITRLLDRMERDGLITRTVSTTDRRRFDVSLTAHGRQRFGQIWPAHADGIQRYFAQHLTPGDTTELARILDTVIQANQNHSQPG